jgi:outer membrane biosynthesis protein TonB
MALLLLVGVIAPAQAAYSPPDGASTGSEKSITLNLTATLETDGDPMPSDSEFTFVLLPDKETYPMPEEGGDKVVLTEAGLIKFGEITFTTPGEYSYVIDQVEGDQANYTYDKKRYSVEVTVYRMESILYMVCRSYEITAEEVAAAELSEAQAAGEDPDVTEAPTTTTAKPESRADKRKTSDMIFNDTYTKPYVPPYTPTVDPSPSPETSPEPSEEPSPEPSEDVEPSPEPSEEPEPSEDPTGPETTPGPSAGPGDGMDNDNKVSNGPGVEESPSPSDKNTAEGGPGTSGGPGGPGSSVKPGTTPKTGDETDNSLWIGMISLAAAGLVGCMLYVLVPRKRRHR